MGYNILQTVKADSSLVVSYKSWLQKYAKTKNKHSKVEETHF